MKELTKNGRIATGVITVICSLFYLFAAVVMYVSGIYIAGSGAMTFWTSVIIGPIGIIGGIMLLTDRNKGGMLIVIAGLVSLATQSYVALIIVTGPPYFMAIIFFIPPIIYLVAGIIGWAIGTQ